MKITIEYEDEQEALQAINGWKWQNAMFNLDQELRHTVKHGFIKSKEATTEQIEAADELRTRIREFMSEHNLTFDD